MDKTFASFFSSAVDLLSVGDLQGRIIAASPSWENALGWTPAEICSRPYLDFVHPDDIEETTAVMGVLLAGKPLRNFTNRYRAKNGSWHDLDWSAALNPHDNLIYATIRDVTERRRAALHHSRIEEVSGVGSWEIDIDNNDIYWSPETYRIHDLPVGSNVSMQDALTFFAPASRSRVEELVAGLMTDGTPYDVELEFVTATGRQRWVRSTARVERRGGRISRAFGTFQDITDRKHLETTLEAERNRLRATLAAIPDLIFEVDSTGTFTGFHAPEGAELFAPPPAFLGRPMKDVLPPDVATIAAEAMQEVDATGLSRGKRYSLQNPGDTAPLWFELAASTRQSDGAGGAPGYLFIARDITETVRADAALRYRDQLLEALFELSPLGIVLNDLETGAFIDANSAFLGFTGYSRAALLQLGSADVAPPDMQSADAEQMAVLRSTGRCGPSEKTFLRRDGKVFPAVANGLLITDASGRKLIWSLVEDITERKERERRLEQAERDAVAARQQLVTAVETLPDGFVLYDADDRLVIANERYKQIYAQSAPVMTPGTPFADILRFGLENGQYAEAVGHEAEWLAERLEMHRNPGPMIEQRLGDGQVLRIFERKTPDGGSVGLRVDVTELYAARERAQEANRSKSLFLANMSHEIRTPLNGILGMADILAGDLTDPDQTRTARTIRESGETLLAILNDLLDMSKIEAGKLLLEDAPFSVTDLARRVEVLHRLRAEKKQVAFQLELGDALPSRMGDAHRVTQILHNLLANAVKFTQTGSVVLRLHGGADAPLVIEVQDTGIGMTPEQIGRIFNDFEQADASMTRRYGGTGLGMSIVRRLTAMMRGTVDVTSTPGLGTTVRVILPLPVVSGQPPFPPAPVPAADTGPSLQGVRALVADDNPINLQILDVFLKRLGVETVLVENGRQAVDAWQPGRFDVLCLDIAMPELDGMAALIEIRRRAGETGGTPPPALAITANAMAHQVADYIKAGFAAHLAKPVRRVELEQQISRLVGSAAH